MGGIRCNRVIEVGTIVHHLQFLERLPRPPDAGRIRTDLWRAKCLLCGTVIDIWANRLRKSCGCLAHRNLKNATG